MAREIIQIVCPKRAGEDPIRTGVPVPERLFSLGGQFAVGGWRESPFHSQPPTANRQPEDI
jgi:hypothetical protein